MFRGDDTGDFSSNRTNSKLSKPQGLTAAGRRKAEREFHVLTTGKALPKILERSSVAALSKSRILNMIAVLWIQDNPIVLFVRGERTELNSKAVARKAGLDLFNNLLQFRRSVLQLTEELEAQNTPVAAHR